MKNTANHNCEARGGSIMLWVLHEKKLLYFGK